MLNVGRRDPLGSKAGWPRAGSNEVLAEAGLVTGTSLLPQSMCPYPAPAHPIGQGGNQSCEACGKPLLYCNRCGAANRLLSRCCRQCGAPRPDQRWSTRGGEGDSFLVKLAVAADAAAKVRWQTKLPEPVTAGALLSHGLLVTLSAGGKLHVLRERVGTPAYSGSLALQDILASPALIDGLLVAAAGNQIQVVDLLAALKVSPESAPRDRMLAVPGSVTSHLASDGKRRVCLTSVDGTRLFLHMLEAGRSVQLQWSRPLSNSASADGYYPVAVTDDAVLVGEPDGHVWAWSAEGGHPLGEDQVEGGLLPLPWVSRSQGVYVAGADGRIYRFERMNPLARLCVADAVDRPLYAFGVSDAHLVTCHGRMVRHVRLATALATQFDLPQPCSLDPLVAQGLAVILSDDGTVYVLDLGPGQGFVRWTQKLFTSQGTVPCPPVATPRTLFACGPDGEVAAVAWTG